MKKLTQNRVNEIAFQVIGAAIEVHKAYGPVHLEKVYADCLEYELELRGLRVTTQQKTLVNEFFMALPEE